MIVMLHFDPIRKRFYGWHISEYPLFQGVVTYMSPVEAFATGIKNFDQWKSSLIAWLLRSEALDHLILQEFKGQNVATPAKYLRKCVDRLILVAQNPSWSLDRLLKRMLIAWFHFDPGRKHFYRRCLCDYPLLFGVINFLQARGMDALATHKATHSVNSFCYIQNYAFSFSVQLEDMKVEYYFLHVSH